MSQFAVHWQLVLILLGLSYVHQGTTLPAIENAVYTDTDLLAEESTQHEVYSVASASHASRSHAYRRQKRHREFDFDGSTENWHSCDEKSHHKHHRKHHHGHMKKLSHHEPCGFHHGPLPPPPYGFAYDGFHRGPPHAHNHHGEFPYHHAPGLIYPPSAPLLPFEPPLLYEPFAPVNSEDESIGRNNNNNNQLPPVAPPTQRITPTTAKTIASSRPTEQPSSTTTNATAISRTDEDTPLLIDIRIGN